MRSAALIFALLIILSGVAPAAAMVQQRVGQTGKQVVLAEQLPRSRTRVRPPSSRNDAKICGHASPARP